MPNSRRAEIIRLTKQARGNLDDCGGFLFQALAVIQDGVADMVAHGHEKRESDQDRIEVYEFLITEAETLMKQIEQLIKIL